jgi:PAB1-binding protein PBP1
MNASSSFWLAAVLLVVLVGAAVWWRQRQRLARLQNELREAQDSRLELIDETQTLRRQLHASVRPPSGARAAASTALADAAQRRAALDLALDAAGPAASGGWQDTMPMGAAGPAPGFQPTQPAPLATRPAELMGDGQR